MKTIAKKVYDSAPDGSKLNLLNDTDKIASGTDYVAKNTGKKLSDYVNKTLSAFDEELKKVSNKDKYIEKLKGLLIKEIQEHIQNNTAKWLKS
jgi:anion-transporting  ArsA/GET3 family ATPase